MSNVSLTKLLKSRRKDLSDGFVVKICNKAYEYSKLKDLSNALSDLFDKHDIEFVISKEASTSDGYHEFGIDQAECSETGTITVYLLRTFLKKFYSQNREQVILGLQSIIAHELVHRDQFEEGRVAYYTPGDETQEGYLTDRYEIEAFCVEIAHDLRINKLDYSHDDAAMVSWRYRELADFYAETEHSHRWPLIRHQIVQICANK